MTDVFLLWHIHGIEPDEPELIGVYTAHARAAEAVKRLATQPGFREHPMLLDDPDPDQGGLEIPIPARRRQLGRGPRVLDRRIA